MHACLKYWVRMRIVCVYVSSERLNKGWLWRRDWVGRPLLRRSLVRNPGCTLKYPWVRYWFWKWKKVLNHSISQYMEICRFSICQPRWFLTYYKYVLHVCVNCSTCSSSINWCIQWTNRSAHGTPETVSGNKILTWYVFAEVLLIKESQELFNVQTAKLLLLSQILQHQGQLLLSVTSEW